MLVLRSTVRSSIRYPPRFRMPPPPDYPGGSIAVTSNGTTPGSGIVWAIATWRRAWRRSRPAPAPYTLTWSSPDEFTASSSALPTVVNGNAYIPTYDRGILASQNDVGQDSSPARALQDSLFAAGRRGRRPQDWSPAPQSSVKGSFTPPEPPYGLSCTSMINLAPAASACCATASASSTCTLRISGKRGVSSTTITCESPMRIPQAYS
jgi:hypothetical protein